MNIENTYTLKNGIKNTFIFLFTTIAVPFIIPLLLPLEVYSDILKEKENNKASLVWSRVVSFIGAIFSLVILPPVLVLLLLSLVLNTYSYFFLSTQDEKKGLVKTLLCGDNVAKEMMGNLVEFYTATVVGIESVILKISSIVVSIIVSPLVLLAAIFLQGFSIFRATQEAIDCYPHNYPTKESIISWPIALLATLASLPLYTVTSVIGSIYAVYLSIKDDFSIQKFLQNTIETSGYLIEKPANCFGLDLDLEEYSSFICSNEINKNTTPANNTSPINAAGHSNKQTPGF